MVFPTDYTQFLPKTNARYAGDPNGDYVLAEHINGLQDAIVRIEKAFGVQPNPKHTLFERLAELERMTPARVPSVHWQNGVPANLSSFNNSINRWSMVILNDYHSTLNQLQHTHLIGRINAQSALAVIQTQINQWKNVGVKSIYLEDFQEVSTRTLENQILQSIYQAGLNPIIQSNQPQRLLSKEIISGYNPQGVALVVKNTPYLVLQNFAYQGRYYTTNELFEQTYPLVQQARSLGFELFGMSNPTTQKQYQYVQTAGLLFGLDALYNGPLNGYSVEPPSFHWHAPMIEWRHSTPTINQSAGRLTRVVRDGLLALEDEGLSYIQGHSISSGIIEWVNNSIPGNVINDGSLHPDKLSSYDVAKIVNLLNASSADIQIDLSKIKMDGEMGLPFNIPAGNMKTHVIEAINKRADEFSTETNQILDAAIKSLNAAKLTGDIPRERFEKYTIPAVNATSSATNYLDQHRIDSVYINSTGTIEANVITASGVQAEQINALTGITTVDLNTTGHHTGWTGEYYDLYVERLRADKLEGLKYLHVEELSADNLNQTILDAMFAEIEKNTFNIIVTKALEADTIKAQLIQALNVITDNQITNSALFGDAVIQTAHIQSLDVAKLNSGVINTQNINLVSPAGHLAIEDKTIKIYDDVDESGNRRLRAILGDTSEFLTDTEDKYGLLVLGRDGTTRLYDNTGVYNAGIHENAISESKLQDDSISERVIQAGAIFTDALQSNVIVSDKIASDAILTRHILAEQIVAGHIHAQAIQTVHLGASIIEAGHIKSDTIEAYHIKSYMITADKLRIGTSPNLIRDMLDSFEQEPVGPFRGEVLTTNTTAVIDETWAWDGRRSLKLSGPTASNRVALTPPNVHSVNVEDGQRYVFSAYVRTFSTNNVPIRLGVEYRDLTKEYSPVMTVTNSERSKRIHWVVTIPEGIRRLHTILAVEATNVEVWFDCLQFELLEGEQDEPGIWKSTAVTRIDGASIETGRVAADRIHIGSGTTYGPGDTIIITDEGIQAKSINGSAMLNSKGLEIKGGAFLLEGGMLDNKITMNGETGLTVSSHISQIEIDVVNGIRVINKAENQVIMDIHPSTGQIRFSGQTTFFSPGNPEMTWQLEDKLEEISGSADRKNSIFTTQPEPPYRVGDLWMKDGDILTAQVIRYEGDNFNSQDWVKQHKYTDDTKLAVLVEEQQTQQVMQLGMLVNRSNFTTDALNWLYFCKLQVNPITFKEELVNENGWIRDLTTQVTVNVPKQSLNLEGAPADTFGYLIYETASKLVSFIYYIKEYSTVISPTTGQEEKIPLREGWRRWNPVHPNHLEYVIMTNQLYIIGEVTTT